MLLSVTVFLAMLIPSWTHGREVFAVVLGNAQDAGLPQSNCRRSCCQKAWNEPSLRRFPTCLAIVDTRRKTTLLIECTPNFPEQIHLLGELNSGKFKGYQLEGLVLTHAHIGHYAGLIQLGREVEGAKGIPVYVMPRMRQFLIKNGPWSQLVQLGNVSLRRLTAQVPQKIGNVEITPIIVPHRDEFSETVGFRIAGPNQSLLFLPDIDKWEKWKSRVEEEIHKVNYALLDGTFFDDKELPGRDMSEIPHPFVVESMNRFKQLSPREKHKIHFIHLNHTNPLHSDHSTASMSLKKAGFHKANQGQIIGL